MYRGTIDKTQRVKLDMQSIRRKQEAFAEEMSQLVKQIIKHPLNLGDDIFDNMRLNAKLTPQDISLLAHDVSKGLREIGIDMPMSDFLVAWHKLTSKELEDFKKLLIEGEAAHEYKH